MTAVCALCNAPGRARGNGRLDLCSACLDRLADLGAATLEALDRDDCDTIADLEAAAFDLGVWTPGEPCERWCAQ